MRLPAGIIVFLLSAIMGMAGNKRIVYMDMRPILNADYTDSITVLDIWDKLHTIATLQGIVNRSSPQLYINYVVNGDIAVDSYWWNKYRSKGMWLHSRDTMSCTSVEKAVSMFKNQLKGAVVYDSETASTSNVASSIAGIDNLIAIRYDKRKESLYSRLITNGPKIPVKVWLVNK
ncbi:MAG TPA: hypothetical protein DEQ84_04310, partial [Prevotellaceae bacterium]|nr:hypothetical protein [Prevotellaceae bacterium]